MFYNKASSMLPGKSRGLCVTFGWDYSSTASTMTAFFLGQMKLGSALLLPPGVGRWGEDQRKDMISSWRVGRIHPDIHPDPDWLDVRYFKHFSWYDNMLSLKGFKLVAYFETTNGSTCKWLLTTDKMVRKIGDGLLSSWPHYSGVIKRGKLEARL
jgi:hypothetical protein